MSETKEKRTAKTPQARFSSKLEYKLTPDEMWACVKGSGQNWGIEGYEIKKKYYDYRQVKWEQERKNILDAHKRVWPPKDWPKAKEEDKQVPPHRKNFIDDYVKWSNSFNDPKKAEEIKQNLESRGTFKPYERKVKKNSREKFLSDEKETKEKIANIPKEYPWKEGAVDSAKQKYEEWKSKIQTPWQKNIERYTKDKPQWPRCDKVSIMSDAQYIGEHIPFYYTYTKEGEETDKNKLFFPKKTFTWKKAPIWSFQNKSPTKLPTNEINERDRMIKEKIDNLKQTKNITDKDLMIDVIGSYEKVTKHGHNYFLYKKPYDYANTEQYKLNKEKCPSYSPGPEHYWKMKDIDKNCEPPVKFEEKEIYGKPGKIYYMNHKRTDFRQYKPLKTSVF